MILPRLVLRHLKHRDDPGFYRLQADDAIHWIQQQGITLGPATSVLDLGCGHGIFGGTVANLGCPVTFADETNTLRPEWGSFPFIPINLDQDDYSKLGTHDLVLCSNVLEHLRIPERFLRDCHQLLNPDGKLYLSWTNWLSPWGGHEFSPFHFLGPRLGPRAYDRLVGRPRIHTPFENLYPTSIGHVLKVIRSTPGIHCLRMAPRYYTELGFVMRVPLLREFLAWNCALLLARE